MEGPGSGLFTFTVTTRSSQAIYNYVIMFFSTVEVSAGSFSHILTTGLKECADNGVPGGLVHARLLHLRDLLDFPSLIGFGLNEI